MENLAYGKCVACHGGIPPMTRSEIDQLMNEVSAWDLIDDAGILKLSRLFRFSSYLDGLEFVKKVAESAEAEDHHPVLILEWGRVRVTWWTHAVKGLHRNDFIMAAKTSLIFETDFNKPSE